MNAKERYNVIINTIEDLVQGKVKDGAIEVFAPLTISQMAFEKAGCYINERSRNVIFMFLMNKNIIDYIQERKMMAAYRCLVDSDEWNKDVVWDAIELAGVGDDKAFAKKFKKYFQVTPKWAFENKDMTLFVQMKDWNALDEGKIGYVEFEEKEMVETKFGISKEKYMLAYAAGNLQAFYNLNEIESELAFDLCQKESLSLEDTFEYIYNYIWSYIDEEKEGRDEYLYEDLMNPDVIYMYFRCGMTFNEIILVLRTIAHYALPRKLESVDKKYLIGFWKYCKYFEDDSMSREYANLYSYEELYTYYNEHGEEDVNKFLEFIEYAKSVSLQDALTYSCFEDNNGYYEEGESWDCVEDVFGADLFDYEPDFDDMDEIQNLWTNDRNQENSNIALNYMEDNFDLSNFESYCDMVDDIEEETKKKSTRRLIGYKNLNVNI